MEEKRKKIAFVSDSVYPYNKGGKEKRNHDVATRLVAAGFEVHVYCMKWWDEPEKAIARDGIFLHAISPLYPLYSGGRRSLRQAIFFAIHCFRLLFESFDVMEVDHIPQTTLIVLKIVALLKRKPLVVVWHEVWGLDYWRQYLGILGFIAYAVEWVGARLPDRIISVSELTTKRLGTVLGREHGVETIPNGVDVSTIASVERAERSSDIIFAGRLLSHKNIDILLRAVAVIRAEKPNISVLIIGDGPERSALESLSRELGLQQNVEFLGFLDRHEDVYALMHSSKVFVLPSDREGFGLVVIEANACGLPVVAIDDQKNAARDLISDGVNGCLTVLDADGLSEKIKLIITNRNIFNPKKYIKKYDWVEVISEIEQIYSI